MSINLGEIEAARTAIVTFARRMLTGELSYLEGSRSIIGLLQAARLEQENGFLPLVGIASETDHIPLGVERKHWHSQALFDLQPEIDRLEQWAKTLGEPTCRAVIQNMQPFANI